MDLSSIEVIAYSIEAIIHMETIALKVVDMSRYRYDNRTKRNSGNNMKSSKYFIDINTAMFRLSVKTNNELCIIVQSKRKKLASNNSLFSAIK